MGRGVSYVDFAQLIKIYCAPTGDEARYSPRECLGCESKVLVGQPGPSHINTGHVERQNLNMRVCGGSPG